MTQAQTATTISKEHTTYETIHNLTADLAEKIRSSGFVPDKIVGVSRGGLMPGVILSHIFDKPFTALNWSTRDFVEENDHLKDQALWVSDQICNHGIKVVVVDDIADTGKTFSGLYDTWLSHCCECTLIRDYLCFASLYKRYTCEFNVDHYAEFIDNDSWIVFPFEVD
jgi:hypoxanthine phosphoribosyltransferase